MSSKTTATAGIDTDQYVDLTLADLQAMPAGTILLQVWAWQGATAVPDLYWRGSDGLWHMPDDPHYTLTDDHMPLEALYFVAHRPDGDRA